VLQRIEHRLMVAGAEAVDGNALAAQVGGRLDVRCGEQHMVAAIEHTADDHDVQAFHGRG
jgi:hypothetical protein